MSLLHTEEDAHTINGQPMKQKTLSTFTVCQLEHTLLLLPFCVYEEKSVPNPHTMEIKMIGY